MIDLSKLSPVLAVVKPFWKPVAAALVIGAVWWGFTTWRDNLVDSAEKRGFTRAEEQYKVLVTAANKIVETDNSTLQLMAATLNGLAAQRQQAIDLKVTPQLERIQNEVASDERYRDCRVSDGVLNAANAARSAVDADISASNPK